MDRTTYIRIRRDAKAAEACDELGLADKLSRDCRKIIYKRVLTNS